MNGTSNSPLRPRGQSSTASRPRANGLLILGLAGILSALPAAGAALFDDLKVQPASPSASAPEPTRFLKVRLSWGHETKASRPFQIRLLANEAAVRDLSPVGFEPGDTLRDGVAETSAGAGAVDGLDFTLAFPERAVRDIPNLQQIWAYLLAHSDGDTVRRLRLDPGFRADARKLTVQMNAQGTQGFSVTVDQLLTTKTFWVPELDVFLCAGDVPVSFAEHQEALCARGGERVLHQIQREPEATYEQYTARWEDMGSPAFNNPHSVPPGHIVCVTWDSAIPKFGIDRGANVWNDYGNPDHFRFGFDFGGLSPNLAAAWKGQKLADGLPVITTTIEKAGVRCEVEQFAYPLYGPPAERRGDIAMVLFQKVRLTELQGRAGDVPVCVTHLREMPAATATVVARTNGNVLLWEESAAGHVLLAVEGGGLALQTNSVRGSKWQTNQIALALTLPANGAREFIVKLPSPLVAPADLKAFLALDYAASRQATLKFWSDYLARGALFSVPEEAVNTLFRANLWHALCLPRRHGGAEANVQLDLPYSNFAYDQHGTPWPVNQAIYVDYMLYDLRGYHAISAEELAAMFRNNQEPNGHVGGFADWGVYTPSMIYAVARHYLLSGDRASLEGLLPQTLKALDWCLGQINRASERGGPTRGLVLAPLNDLSHDLKAWSFNQAYLYAAPELLGRVLADIQHPRASECRAAAQALHDAVQRGYAYASMQSPLVQLRDHTWTPYVPGDALEPRRLLDIWYPTDIDCGPLHMSRLKALDPNGPLTTCLLNDNEDNLFFKQWGMANEPVYNPHATAYLLRDDPKPAIRAFYSMMACAFSHSTFEPVEHRWGWGQYFGPPSTDGAWFELYRQMLIREGDDDTLLLCQATPRAWLENGKRIEVRRAPTSYGPLSFTTESRADAGEITATIQMPGRKQPAALLVRFRHPREKPLRASTVNGQEWKDFDPAKEWVRIPQPKAGTWVITARY